MQEVKSTDGRGPVMVETKIEWLKELMNRTVLIPLYRLSLEMNPDNRIGTVREVIDLGVIDARPFIAVDRETSQDPKNVLERRVVLTGNSDIEPGAVVKWDLLGQMTFVRPRG